MTEMDSKTKSHTQNRNLKDFPRSKVLSNTKTMLVVREMKHKCDVLTNLFTRCKETLSADGHEQKKGMC